MESPQTNAAPKAADSRNSPPSGKHEGCSWLFRRSSSWPASAPWRRWMCGRGCRRRGGLRGTDTRTDTDNTEGHGRRGRWSSSQLVANGVLALLNLCCYLFGPVYERPSSRLLRFESGGPLIHPVKDGAPRPSAALRHGYGIKTMAGEESSLSSPITTALLRIYR